MKKGIVVTLLCILLLYMPSYANGYDLSKYIPEEMENSLPDDIITGTENQKSIDTNAVFSSIKDIASDSLGSVISSFFAMLSMIIICVIFSMLCESIKSDSAKKVFSYISSICFALVLYGILSSLWDDMRVLFDDIYVLMQALTPSVSLLYALGGNVTTAAVTNAGMSIMLTVFTDICHNGLRPVLQIAFGFSIISCMSGSINLAPMARFVRSTYTTILVFSVSTLTTVMSMQSFLAGATDTLAGRSVRFASSVAVPIVGGALSEAAAGVAGSIGALKTSFGILGVLAIAVMVLPLLVKLWINKLALSLGGVICSVFGISREGELISSAAELINFALAITFSLSLMFIINLCIFAGAATALGG